MTGPPKIDVLRVADLLPRLDADRHMGKREAAEFLGLGVRTIEGMLDEIPHFRVGAKVLFRRSELVAWMDRHREQTTAADWKRIVDDVVASVLGPKRTNG
jgi:excisionase family DNA binding protein